MIAYLHGTIKDKGLNYAIVEVSGVGYQVFLPEGIHSEVRKGQDFETYIHHIVREEASDLYGFRNLEELGFFQSLLSVSGVGPKSALGIMSAASLDDVREAVARGDASLLTKVSGIGKKTAERLVLELKGKVAKSIAGLSLSSGTSFGDDLDALMALGYSLSEAREALSQVPPAVTDGAQRVKEALKAMGKNKIR